jgi:Tol biopolymer transport system component
LTLVAHPDYTIGDMKRKSAIGTLSLGLLTESVLLIAMTNLIAVSTGRPTAENAVCQPQPLPMRDGAVGGPQRLLDRPESAQPDWQIEGVPNMLSLRNPDVHRDAPRSELNLSEIPFKIVHETYRETNGKENWELHLINADGSNPVNLTNTPDIDEMYPHVSGDGTKICFVADEGPRRRKVRSVYYMNIDGTNRVKVAEDARQPCWSPDGKKIAYLTQEYERYSTREYATGGLFIYDLQTGEHKEHPNKHLQHIYAICWSPDGNWFLAAVHGGMEYSDVILAIQANGTRMFDLGQWGVKGCRPDLSIDGTKMVWGETDWNLCIADIDLTPAGGGRDPVQPFWLAAEPRVTNIHDVVRCLRNSKVYHVDISPDSKYIAFSYGPFKGEQQVGGKAKGWNICVGDLTGKWVQITTDGNHNKEPDWVPSTYLHGKAEKDQSPQTNKGWAPGH